MPELGDIVDDDADADDFVVIPGGEVAGQPVANHGAAAFTVPLFDEFMQRIMLGEDWRV